jgi:hypothetical protein
VQEPFNKRTADNDPVRSSGAAVLIEGVNDGNASGTEKINPTQIEDEPGRLPNEPCLPQTGFEARDIQHLSVDVDPRIPMCRQSGPEDDLYRAVMLLLEDVVGARCVGQREGVGGEAVDA